MGCNCKKPAIITNPQPTPTPEPKPTHNLD